jgi:LPS export ABC transporter protein LptC
MRIFLALTTLFYLVSCTDPKPTPVQNFSLPETQAEGIVLQIGQQDKPLLKVIAGKMQRLQRPDSLFTLIQPKKPDSLVYVTLFDEKGDTRATMQMQKLHYYEEPLRFEAFGKVKIISENKQLRASKMNWQQADKKIIADGFVKIETPQERIEGYNFKANEDLSQYEIHKITGFFQLNP